MTSSNENNSKKSPWDDDSEPKTKSAPTNNPQQVDIESLFRKGHSSFNDVFSKFKKDSHNSNGSGNNNGRFLGIIGLLLVFTWILTGFYIVDEGEQALVIRFGKYERTAYTGLNYHLPSPIEHIIKEKVATLRKEEIGFRSAPSYLDRYNGNSSNNNKAQVMQESLMLTGDQNIVEINFIIQWKIANLKDFVFNIDGTRETVKSVAESSMREVIGNTPIDRAITDGRSNIEHNTKVLLQEILDSYKAGVEITTLKLLKSDPPTEVIDAFRDVQTAKTDKEREINRGYSYSNEIIPKARGEAAQIILASEGYEKEVVERAMGESGRFDLLYNQYKVSKDVTKKRIYLESMDKLLKGMDKIIIDQKNTVPYLPLTQLDQGK
ncbi:MAG: FtsH protease activity modulator HflK [Rickettsiales bacterium]|jgi:membrane protease subunit HflK|nr:FtsH protease activity modulator HflK [Rickettsiales bacterium]